MTEATDAARETALRSHIAEVSQRMSATLESGQMRVDTTTLRDYLRDLRADLKSLDDSIAVSDLESAGMVRTVFRDEP